MSQQSSLIEQTVQAFRDHGLTTAIGVWFTFIAGLATAVTRKAFTNEALLHKLEQELAEERARVEKQRDDDRQVDHERLARIERDIHDMRTLIFAAFQRRDGD
ncbi:MgtC/SapB family protein [Roseinatronobacter sp.]|uniref:MgtC/SapB family protein n=1 Tax=Roseinatronobacter sp. TaxID=1945755 RepID=UPI0025E583CF|nr:MgtC/SapB family protein [Roseibaca sp.]